MTRNSQVGDDAYRQLWAEVVRMAACDLMDEPIDSVDYNQSVSFFLGDGPWAAWRTEVAGMLDLHPDDLKRYGRRLIIKRLAERQAAVLEPVRPQVTPSSVEKRTPLVVPQCVVQLKEARERAARRVKVPSTTPVRHLRVRAPAATGSPVAVLRAGR